MREAICVGHGFNIDFAISYYHSFQFGSSDLDEGEFVLILTIVLHLLICSHKIGLDYAAIVGAGIGCMKCRCEDQNSDSLYHCPPLRNVILAASIVHVISRNSFKRLQGTHSIIHNSRHKILQANQVEKGSRMTLKDSSNSMISASSCKRSFAVMLQLSKPQNLNIHPNHDEYAHDPQFSVCIFR